MRLLHVIPSYLPAVRYGGAVIATHGLCRALVAAGHAVDVFTTRVDGPADVAVDAGARQDLDGVGVHYFPVPRLRRWFWSPALSRALRRRVHEYDAVHVHALFLHPSTAAGRAALAAGVPYVLSPRGMLVRELVARRNAVLKRAWIALLGRPLIRGASRLHVTSTREREDVQAFGLRLPPVVEIPNGIDTPAMADTERDADLVLFLGRVSWKKGIDRLLDAMALLPGRRLVVAGNDDENLLPVLRRRAARLELGARVEFTGAVDARQRAAWYARAGVFVLPSLSENFANTVLEAMAAACPVVLTAGVGLAATVEEGGCGIVCAGDPAAIAMAIEQVLADPVRASRMGAAGRRIAGERFTWPRVAAEMSACYQALRSGA